MCNRSNLFVSNRLKNINMASKLKLHLIVTFVIFCSITIIRTSQGVTRDVTENTKLDATMPPVPEPDGFFWNVPFRIPTFGVEVTERNYGQSKSPGKISTTAKNVEIISTDSNIPIRPPEQSVWTTNTIMTFETITQSDNRKETATTFPNETLTHSSTSTTPEHEENQTHISDMVLRYHGMHHLLKDILLDYDKRLRPRANQSRFVFIQSTFVPLKIIDFDTVKNNFTLMGYFRMQWRDDFLTWTPEDYGNTTGVRIPANTVWIPRLSIAKGQSNRKWVGNPTTDIVALTNKGYVQWWPEGIYSVVCDISIMYFPLDEQVCTLTYYIADEDVSTVKLSLLKPIIMESFSENTQWDLKNVTSEIQWKRNAYMVHFNFTIKRRAGFAMYTLLLPAFLMSGLCCCTFLVPVETGEKGSIAVNVFLACIVYVTLVTHNVPSNSVELSYFVLYVVHLLSISALSTLYTIVQSYLHHHRNSRGCTLIVSLFCPSRIPRSFDVIAFTISAISVIGCMTLFLVFLY